MPAGGEKLTYTFETEEIRMLVLVADKPLRAAFELMVKIYKCVSPTVSI